MGPFGEWSNDLFCAFIREVARRGSPAITPILVRARGYWTPPHNGYMFRAHKQPEEHRISVAKLTFGLCGVGVVLALLCFLVLPGTSVPSDRSTELDDAARDQLAARESVAAIAAESDALDTPGATAGTDAGAEAETVAPPGFAPSSPVDREPTPPEGYSFASYREVDRVPTSANSAVPHDFSPAWMESGERALADRAAAAGRDWTFAYVKLAADAEVDALRRTLAAEGGEVLGHSGDLVRVRLPADEARLRAIAAADAVAGLGAVPPGRKITDALVERANANISQRVPVWITLMADDRDGRWRDALKAMGAEVGRFDPAIRTYAATIPLTALEPLAQADFVVAVESIGRVERALEIAAPSMGADALRSYDASLGTFVGTGGASVPVGVMDTALNIDHPDISSGRRSICGANFTDFLDSREEDQDLWFDFGEHGSHVTGIVVGNGADDRDRAGMAPLVRDIRFAKVISSYGSASALGWSRAMDWFAKPTACSGDDTARKALVINSSLGVSSDIWEGRSVVERKIDASVWAAKQLFVTSARRTRFPSAPRRTSATSPASAAPDRPVTVG